MCKIAIQAMSENSRNVVIAESWRLVEAGIRTL
jgi:hypothetical protein